MDVFFGYQRLGLIFKTVVPLALGVDMLHSFYLVGCLIKEKRQLDAQRAAIITIHTTASLFKRISSDCMKTEYNFWPNPTADRIQSTSLPALSSLPRPSYELDDGDEDETDHQPQPMLTVYPLKAWKPAARSTLDICVLPTETQLDHATVQNDDVVEEAVIALDVEEDKKTRFDLNLSELAEEVYKLIVPYPIRHPRRFAMTIASTISREIRLHIKKSDAYFESRGMWIRSALQLPYIIVERRSALRFRFRAISAA